MNSNPSHPIDVSKIERPDPTLFQYYLLCAILTGPISPLVLLPLWLRYITLRYKFGDDGVSMSWGVFFRREVYLTYRRIQDIHVTKNLLQRWMGLAKISLQTASGNASAEMVIEGILQAEELRDLLYSRMRGARANRSDGLRVPPTVGNGITPSIGIESTSSASASGDRECDDEVLQLLTEIRHSLQLLAQREGREP